MCEGKGGKGCCRWEIPTSLGNICRIAGQSRKALTDVGDSAVCFKKRQPSFSLACPSTFSPSPTGFSPRPPPTWCHISPLLVGHTNDTKTLPSAGRRLEPRSDEAGAVKRWLTTGLSFFQAHHSRSVVVMFYSYQIHTTGLTTRLLVQMAMG